MYGFDGPALTLCCIVQLPLVRLPLAQLHLLHLRLEVIAKQFCKNSCQINGDN